MKYNIDTKIGSKAIARRLQGVIPDIVHHNQNAYVKEKSIFDAVRAIDDIKNLWKVIRFKA